MLSICRIISSLCPTEKKQQLQLDIFQSEIRTNETIFLLSLTLINIDVNSLYVHRLTDQDGPLELFVEVDGPPEGPWVGHLAWSA